MISQVFFHLLRQAAVREEERAAEDKAGLIEYLVDTVSHLQLLYVTLFTHNCLSWPKCSLTLQHRGGGGDFCVTTLTSSSFLHYIQSLNCAHNRENEQLLPCLQQKKAAKVSEDPLWVWAPEHSWR